MLKNLDYLIKKVDELVDENFNTTARIEISDFFQLKKYTTIFSLIAKIQNLRGFLDHELSNYRDMLTNEMIETIKNIHGDEIAEKVYNAL